MLPSDSSLALLCAPSPSPLFHFTPQRSGFLLSLSLTLARGKSWERKKKEAEACIGGEGVGMLSTPSAGDVVSSAALKNADILSPTSPCCKQG